MLYPNDLKIWEFDKDAPKNFCPERATIAERQGTSEDNKLEVEPTTSKTKFSSRLGMQLGVIGALGKMGSRVCQIAEHDPEIKLIAADDKRELFQRSDVIIDFSSHLALEEHLKLALEYARPLVIGTTGHANFHSMKLAGEKIPILYSPNFSIGIALLERAIKEIFYHPDSIEIVETHHAGKKDAPSGTALLLAENFGGRAAIRSIRTGDAIGEHTVILQYEGERIELCHKVQSRDTFAFGALKAAKVLSHKPPGFYTLRETLPEIHDGCYGKGKN